MRFLDVLVQGQNLILVSSLVVTSLLYYYGLQILKNEKSIMELLLNSFIYGLLLWKFSYILLHPNAALQNPISMLYFNGGYAGIGIGVIFVSIYTWFYMKKHDILILSYLKAVTPIYFGYFSTFIWVFVSETPQTVMLLQGIVSVGFFLVASLKIGKNTPLSLLIWFHVIQFELALYKHNFVYSGLLTKEVLLYDFFIIALVSLSYWLEKKEIKDFSKEMETKRKHITNQIAISIIIVTLAVTSIITNLHGNIQTDRASSNIKPSREVGLHKGQIAPDFELDSISGNKMKLSDFRGKTVILNFWATWCPPCKAEIPELKRFYQDNKNNNVDVVGVNLTKSESNPEAVKDFVKNNEMSFPILLDKEGKIGDIYNTITIPTSYIIDKNGVIQDKYVGAMSYETMSNFISNVDK